MGQSTGEKKNTSLPSSSAQCGREPGTKGPEQKADEHKWKQLCTASQKNIYPDSHKFLIRYTKVNYPPFKCVHSCVVKGNIQELYSNPPIGGNQVAPMVIAGHHVPCLAHTRVDLQTL